MDNLSPKGLTVEKINNKVIISTDKKELVYSDYFGIFFCCFGFIIWIYGLVDMGFTDFYIFFSIIFLGLLGYLFASLILSFYEYQVVTITDKSIEINKKRPIFSTNQILDKQSIEKIDFKELKFFSLTMPSGAIMFKWSSNLGYYKIPRIVYKGNDIYIFEHYKKSIRVWIIDSITDLNEK